MTVSTISYSIGPEIKKRQFIRALENICAHIKDKGSNDIIYRDDSNALCDEYSIIFRDKVWKWLPWYRKYLLAKIKFTCHDYCFKVTIYDGWPVELAIQTELVKYQENYGSNPRLEIEREYTK